MRLPSSRKRSRAVSLREPCVLMAIGWKVYCEGTLEYLASLRMVAIFLRRLTLVLMPRHMRRLDRRANDSHIPNYRLVCHYYYYYYYTTTATTTTTTTTTTNVVNRKLLTMSDTSMGCRSVPASHWAAVSAGWVPAVGGKRSAVTTSVCSPQTTQTGTLIFDV